MKIFGKEWFSIGRDEAAIIFGKVRVDFHWPHPDAKPRQELVDTVTFIQYAMGRSDWWEEWTEHETAMAELAAGPPTEYAGPVLTVLEGGKGDSQDPT